MYKNNFINKILFIFKNIIFIFSKMISNFWKKITIYNFSILIIVLRIYDPIKNYIFEHSENNTIFAKSGENGYPFLESLKYDINDVKQITNSIINKSKNNKQLIPIPQTTPNRCSFLNRISICNDSKDCFDEITDIKEGKYLYHKKDEYNNSKIINNDMLINLMQEKNQFLYEKNNMIEIPFYNQIIDGYSSYLSIISNDINLIKQITHDENKMNNLLFLYVLYLKCHTINDNIRNDIKINKLLEYQKENIYKETSSLDELKVEQMLLITNKILREEIINCIPDLDTRYSFFIDLQSIYSMMQTLFQVNKGQNYLKMFDFLFYRLTNAINNIFILDDEINEKSKKFLLFKKYCSFIYWSFSIIIIFFLNRYFIKHKEFYKSKNRTVKNINANSEYKKYLKYQDNINKMQKKNRSKYTKEEIEMINKLTRDQKDYIISK